jgi:SlyX protein
MFSRELLRWEHGYEYCRLQCGLLPSIFQPARCGVGCSSGFHKGQKVVHEQRLIDIESKLAHQEHLLSCLDEALTRQQAQLTRLEELCRSLLEQIRSLSEQPSAGAGGDERPPHY